MKNIEVKATTVEELRNLLNSQMVTSYQRVYGEDNGAIKIERLTLSKRLEQLENCLCTGKELLSLGYTKDDSEEPIQVSRLYIYDLGGDDLFRFVGKTFEEVLDFIITNEDESLNGDNGYYEWSTIPDYYQEKYAPFE